MRVLRRERSGTTGFPGRHGAAWRGGDSAGSDVGGAAWRGVGDDTDDSFAEEVIRRRCRRAARPRDCPFLRENLR